MSLVADKITKSYKEKIILKNISFSCPDGKFFGLVGPSGCGKTTLLRIIAGLEKADRKSTRLNSSH